MELISREQTLGIFKMLNLFDPIIGTETVVTKLVTDLERAIYKTIEDLPIIESRPKGKWEDNAIGYSCNLCGRAHIIKDNYCPNCGADMRGEE